jgi:hypothetical protein
MGDALAFSGSLCNRIYREEIVGVSTYLCIDVNETWDSHISFFLSLGFVPFQCSA